MWRLLWDTTRPLSFQHGNLPSGTAENQPAVGCFSPEEVALVAEVELHVCASLRHLARASSEDIVPAFHASGASHGCVEFDPLDPLATAEESREDSGLLSPCRNVYSTGSCKMQAGRGTDHTDDSAPRLGDDGDGSGNEGETVDASLTSSFAKAFERVVLVAWTLFVHSQLVNALLRGDIVCCVAWSMRFMGIGEPWSMRRIHELVVSTLEVLVEPHGPGADAARSCPQALHFLRDSCETYLRLPVIPRFKARLHRAISELCDLGVLSHGASPSEDAGHPGLQAVIAAILSPDGVANEAGQPSVAYGPDESPEALPASRAHDPLHERFRGLAAEAAAAHLGGACALNARQRLLGGAEALALLRAGGPRAEERRRHFEDVLASVPQRARCLADLEDDERASGEGGPPGAIGPEDVLVDVWADLREFEALTRLVGQDNCGFCCTPSRRPQF